MMRPSSFNLLITATFLCYSLCRAITYGRVTSRAMAPSIALIHIARKARHVRGHGYAYQLKDEYCTGSLISRQVIITAGHCIHGKTGYSGCRGTKFKSIFSSKLEDNGTITIASKHAPTSPSRKAYLSGPDVALLLLNKPVNVCERSDPVHERLGIVRLPLGNPRSHWTDDDVETAECTMFGYGKHEKHTKIDFRLRSMSINLKAMSPVLAANLTDHRKICAGDSGGPVICHRGGIPYLIGLSTSVISSRTSKTPQLCRLRTSEGEYAEITGAKFYDVRRGVPRILRFLNVHGQINNMISDYSKCFDGIR